MRVGTVRRAFADPAAGRLHRLSGALRVGALGNGALRRGPERFVDRGAVDRDGIAGVDVGGGRLVIVDGEGFLDAVGKSLAPELPFGDVDASVEQSEFHSEDGAVHFGEAYDAEGMDGIAGPVRFS